MKVGIVTINGNENYGNVLQNYAVQEVLKEVGAEAETILNRTQYGHCTDSGEKINKLTPSYIKKYVTSQLNYKYNIKNSNQGLLKAVRFYRAHKDEIEKVKEKRREKFIAFKDEYIVHAEEVLDINKKWTSQQVDKYSYFVSGSDQVWNPIYPSTSSINFLQFAPKEKRITISPSFGINKIPKELQDDYGKWIASIGSDKLIDNVSFSLIIINCYLQGQSAAFNNARIAKGNFGKDKNWALAQALVNLVVSIIAGHYLGLVGIYIGTVTSRLVYVVCRPYSTYRFLFEESSVEYYKKFLLYFIAVIFTAIISKLLTYKLLVVPKVGTFVVAVFIVGIVVNLCFLLMFFKSQEMKAWKDRIYSIIIGKRK